MLNIWKLVCTSEHILPPTYALYISFLITSTPNPLPFPPIPVCMLHTVSLCTPTPSISRYCTQKSYLTKCEHNLTSQVWPHLTSQSVPQPSQHPATVKKKPYLTKCAFKILRVVGLSGFIRNVHNVKESNLYSLDNAILLVSLILIHCMVIYPVDSPI